MRRAWGWAGVAAVAWLLAALPTPVVALGTAGAILESTYNIVSLHLPHELFAVAT